MLTNKGTEVRPLYRGGDVRELVVERARASSAVRGKVGA